MTHTLLILTALSLSMSLRAGNPAQFNFRTFHAKPLFKNEKQTVKRNLYVGPTSDLAI